jgi:enoyl-CoA hydratase/carnithine racemase
MNLTDYTNLALHKYMQMFTLVAFLMIGGATHVVAVESAKFGLPEVKRGIFPFQVMATLEPLMSARQLLDLCLRAKTLTAQEAKEIGLVSVVVQQKI